MKKKQWLWAAVAFAVMLAGTAGWFSAHPTEGSRGVLYHVTGGNGDMYLLGSIHIGNQDMYPFGDSIQQAMEAADTFVYECDTTSQEVLADLRSRMALPEGQTLQTIIGDPLYTQLAEVCDQLSLSLDTLNGQKPWAVINTLAVYSTAAELGTKNVNQALSLGVEKHVQAYAARHDKKTVYLETASAQTDILEGFSAELKQYLLQTECDTILTPQNATGMDASIASWPQWWSDGDVDAFAAQYQRSYLTPGYETVGTEYHTKLITLRNESMGASLAAMAADGGSYFVTVGLLHLVLPDDSIVSYLQAQGFTVTLVTQ